jgi:fatty-acyl-CoA synthase
MYREDQKAALKKLGPVLVQYFGLGEVTGAITVLPASEHYLDDTQMRVGTCGYARTGMQIAILDDEANELPLGQTGAIGVRGPAVFSGYFNNQKANDESFQNGWFLTGDIGHMDDAGYVYLTGRKSDMYISGGSNVYPRESEEKLLEHPAIAEIAIVGIPDADWGEVGAAVIVLTNGATVTETELRSWFNDKIARYKQPKLIVFRDELPKSGYGKIEKRRVRELLLADGLIKEIQ